MNKLWKSGIFCFFLIVIMSLNVSAVDEDKCEFLKDYNLSYYYDCYGNQEKKNNQLQINELENIPFGILSNNLNVNSQAINENFSVIRDYGLDIDGNGLFDKLIIEVNVSVPENDWYFVDAVIEGNLNDNEFNDKIYLLKGNNILYLNFNGMDIHEKGVNNNYSFFYFRIESVRFDFDFEAYSEIPLYITKFYNYDEFEFPSIEVINMSYKKVDYNGNNLYDELVVEVLLDVKESKKYEIFYDLDEGDIAVYKTEKIYLEKGLQKISYNLSGKLISSIKGNDLKVYFYINDFENDYDNYGELIIYNHNFSEYEQVVLNVTLIDINNNSFYDYLNLNFDLPLLVENYCVVHGDLRTYDKDGVYRKILTSKIYREDLENISLNFSGQTINFYGASNYILRDFRAYCSDGEGGSFELEFGRDVYSFVGYNSTQFEEPSAVINGYFRNELVDIDNNGLFDELIVKVGVNVSHAGWYNVYGSFEDFNGRRFYSGFESDFLEEGVNTLDLKFSGIDISKYGSNGVSKLDYIELYYLSSEYIGNSNYTYYFPINNVSRYEYEGVQITDIDDFGVDLDNDGFYDILRLKIFLDVLRDGEYEFYIQNSPIYENQYFVLNKDDKFVYFDIVGKEIYLEGDNDYYNFRIDVYQNSYRIDNLEYVTHFYNFSQFEKPEPNFYIRTNIVQRAVEGENVSIELSIENEYDSLPLNFTLDVLEWEGFANSINLTDEVFYLENGNEKKINFSFNLKNNSIGYWDFKVNVLVDEKVVESRTRGIYIEKYVNLSEIFEMLILESVGNCSYNDYRIRSADSNFIRYDVYYNCGEDDVNVEVYDFYHKLDFDFFYNEMLIDIFNKRFVASEKFNKTFYEGDSVIFWKSGGDKFISIEDFELFPEELFQAYSEIYPSNINESIDFPTINHNILNYSYDESNYNWDSYYNYYSFGAEYYKDGIYFDSYVLDFETKEDFKNYFREEIFEEYESNLSVEKIFNQTVYFINQNSSLGDNVLFAEDFNFDSNSIVGINCSDGFMNGDESGIDCGGNCSSPCPVFPPSGGGGGSRGESSLKKVIWTNGNKILSISWSGNETPYDLIEAYLEVYPSDLFSGFEGLILEDIGDYSFIGVDFDTNNERWWNESINDYIDSETHFVYYNNGYETVIMMVTKTNPSFFSIFNFIGLYSWVFEKKMYYDNELFFAESISEGIWFWKSGNYVLGMDRLIFVDEVFDAYLEIYPSEFVDMGVNNPPSNDNSNNDGSGSSGGGGGGGGSSLSSSNISNTSNLVSNVSSSSNDLIALGTDVIQTSSSDKDVENSSNQGRSFLTGAFIGVGDGLGFLGDLFLRILDWVKGLFG